MGKSCSFGYVNIFFILCLFVMIFVVSHFSFEGGTVVLIVPVPGHCLPLTINEKEEETPYFYHVTVL